MRNKFILILTILAALSDCAFAASEPKVISDTATKKQVVEAFADINRHTDNFFTPIAKKKPKTYEERQEENYNQLLQNQQSKGGQTHGTMPPVKKFRLKIQHRNDPKVEVVEAAASKNQALLDCDTMEYFATRTELEANGNVVVFFPQNNSTIKADKMIYNQTSNLIKAFGNVVLINDGKELFGDYMQIDMNEENAFMDNPKTDILQVIAKAKKGYMYGDKIIQEQGSIYVAKKTMIKLRSEMFGPDLEYMYLDDKDKSYYKKEGHGEAFKIKTNDLILNSKSEHDTITLKHADIYFHDKKVGVTIPSITIHMNKAQDYVEANYPEMGTMMNMGAYIGPGFVFDTPMGTNLKLVPFFNYDAGGGDGDSKGNTMGFGGIAKFKSATNKTDIAYGTVHKKLIVRGKQKLDDNLWLQYGSNAYMDDWFLGFRMPKYIGELVYEDSFANPRFMGSCKKTNFDMTFRHRIAGAYAQDNDSDGHSNVLGAGGVGTLRLKYMAEAAQTVWQFGQDETPFNGRLEIVGQTSAAVYGTGGTQVIARIGPRLHSQYKFWMQDVGYFQSEYSDKTPLVMFDKYMYGRSNAYLRESLRVHKYLTLSWFGSLNLSKDSWDGNMLQENSFFFSIGPDDIKLNIGYDTVRQQSFVTMALALDAKGSTVEYKKMVIKNPEKVGKNKDGSNVNSSQTFTKGMSNDEDAGPERAEIIDIPEVRDVL